MPKFYDVEVISCDIEDNNLCSVDVDISIDELFYDLSKNELEEIIDNILQNKSFSIEHFVDRLKSQHFCDYDKNKLKELIAKI